jgi:hypothetical protein
MFRRRIERIAIPTADPGKAGIQKGMQSSAPATNASQSLEGSTLPTRITFKILSVITKPLPKTKRRIEPAAPQKAAVRD